MKILLVGDSNARVSEIFQLYGGEKFQTSNLKTKGTEFSIKTVIIGKQIIRTQIWWLSSNSEFNNMRETLSTGSNGGIFVFDRNSRRSFNKIKRFIDEILSKKEFRYFNLQLLGIKSNLPNENTEEVINEECNKYCTSITSQDENNIIKAEYHTFDKINLQEIEIYFEKIIDNYIQFMNTKEKKKN